MSKNKGFTMIELLVVISVLGILAAGILAAIDPFEQLKKARDTSNRDSVLALHQAFIRYYGTHGSLPWDNAAVNTSTTCAGPGMFGSPRGGTAVALDDGGARMGSATAPGTTCTGLLESEGELKTGFVAAVGGTATAVWVNSPSKAATSVCFSPASKSMFAEDSVKFGSLGNDLSATTCAATAKTALTPGTTCFYCAK